jgi:hypothetical protein
VVDGRNQGRGEQESATDTVVVAANGFNADHTRVVARRGR